MPREVVVVGAGIVGTIVARDLASRSDIRVTVLERDGHLPRGSTGLAPGLVGLYNEAAVLTDLARTSAEAYEEAGVGFARTGGLELATSSVGSLDVERRAAAAREVGLRATLLAPGQLPGSIARYVDVDQVAVAAFFPDDGSAEPSVLRERFRELAESEGGVFAAGTDVVAIEAGANRLTVTVSSGERLPADDVVLAGGVWGPTLADLVDVDLPLVPVAHPYAYSSAQSGLEAGPFVRWPDRHVYGRVHQGRLGIGTYDHRPIPVTQAELANGAGLAWAAQFTPAVEAAQRLLRTDVRFEPERLVNGAFAMTPDNLPYIGPHPSLQGVWIAQGIWVTHAAGAADLLSRAMTDGRPLPEELSIDRFDGRAAEELRATALRLYRDIYAGDSPRRPVRTVPRTADPDDVTT